MDRLSAARRPTGRAVGFQSWRRLLFLHWEVAAETIAPLLPPRLSVDTFEGRAYVGLVPFTMRDVRPWWSPSVPGVSDFHELNLRTYVHHQGADPGVWFFSLDAASSLAVVLARSNWSLPYHRASIVMASADDEVSYASRRLWPGPKPAELRLRYRPSEQLDRATAGTLEHFLIERYTLYALTPFGLASGRVHHVPYPLRRAQIVELRENVIAAAGFTTPQSAPHILASDGVDVEIFPLRRLL